MVQALSTAFNNKCLFIILCFSPTFRRKERLETLVIVCIRKDAWTRYPWLCCFWLPDSMILSAHVKTIKTIVVLLCSLSCKRYRCWYDPPIGSLRGPLNPAPTKLTPAPKPDGLTLSRATRPCGPSKRCTTFGPVSDIWGDVILSCGHEARE
jgi:hypothetical protein